MVLRVDVGELQSEHVVVKSALDRKKDRVVLGFSNENDQYGENYETEAFVHLFVITLQKYKKIVET